MSRGSIFTYSVTRQYPSKFTWIILGGGAAIMTFFTFVAVAGNAYQLDTKYSNDYNATITNKTWYQRQEFAWATDMETTCQPALLTIGGDYTTTNQGFHYSIGSFRHTDNANDIPSTASYRNGSLSSCQVRELVIELLRKNQGRLARNFWTWQSSYARSTTECTMDTDDGPMRVNLTSQLPPASRRDEITDGFLALNDPAHPGRYIGAKLLSAWLSKLSTAMSYNAPGDLRDRDAASWGSGTITLTRNRDEMDYKSMEFFTCDGGFSDSGGGLSSIHPPHTMQNWHDQWTQEAINDDYYAQLPNISIVVDVFAKSYYSLLLSDFNSTDDTKATNALSSAEGLEYLQSITDTDLAAVAVLFGEDEKEKGTIGQAFSPTDYNLTQPLGFAQHTTIFSQYLCSIPRPKNTFKLLFAVAVADLVFLRTCWTIFGLIATWWLGRSDSSLQHCAGCINGNHDIPLMHASGAGGGASYSQVSSDAGDENRGKSSQMPPPQITRVRSGV